MDKQVLFKYISDSLGVSLTTQQKEYAIELYSSMDNKIFAGHKLSVIGPILGKVIGEKVKEKTVLAEQNLKDYQIAALGSADTDPDAINLLVPDKSVQVLSFLGINDLYEFKRTFNPSSLYERYYVVLDYENRNQAEETKIPSKFTWNYAPNSFQQPGYCTSSGLIKNIVHMRMYQPRIPSIRQFDQSGKSVSVLFEEFAAQSFILPNGRRFHFLLRPLYINGDYAMEAATEDYNDGLFYFRKPIRNFSTLTVSFGNPDNVVVFDSNLVLFPETVYNFIIPIEFTCLKSDT